MLHPCLCPKSYATLKITRCSQHTKQDSVEIIDKRVTLKKQFLVRTTHVGIIKHLIHLDQSAKSVKHNIGTIMSTKRTRCTVASCFYYCNEKVPPDDTCCCIAQFRCHKCNYEKRVQSKQISTIQLSYSTECGDSL